MEGDNDNITYKVVNRQKNGKWNRLTTNNVKKSDDSNTTLPIRPKVQQDSERGRVRYGERDAERETMICRERDR